jgi:hypothetical protein
MTWFTSHGLAAVAALMIAAGGLASGPASAGQSVTPAIEAAAQAPSRSFARCMRAKYGPRYYARVPRAMRFEMAKACQ